MRNRWKSLLLVAGLAASMPAAGHLETELYIPIGKSPGISQGKSMIGRIEAPVATQKGLTIRVPDRTQYVVFDESTKIYVQYDTPGKHNRLGTYSDCQVERPAEVYVGDKGTVLWIKVLMR